MLDVLATLVQHKRGILFSTLICGVVAALVGLFSPHTFQTTVSILPPEKSDRGGLGMLMQSASSSLFDISSMGENRSSDYFLDVLHSRTILDSVLADYKDIREHFASGAGLHSDEISALGDAVSVAASHDGMVTVTVKIETGINPSQEEQRHIATLTALVANALTKELDKINRVKIVSRAHNARVYIEEQLVRVKTQLDSTYALLTAFQQQYKVLALDKQVESEVKSASELQSQIMELEYQQRYQGRSQTSNNIESQQLRERIASLKEQYTHMQVGAGDSNDYFIPFPRIPELQRTYANMVRDLKALEQVYAYLQTQFFQERVQEERDTPTVLVLDAPTVPERRSSPARTLWVIFGLMIGFVGASLFAVLRVHVFSFAHRPEEQARFNRVIGLLSPRLALLRKVRRSAAHPTPDQPRRDAGRSGDAGNDA